MKLSGLLGTLLLFAWLTPSEAQNATALSEAARRSSPANFVHILADLSMPAGIELRELDRWGHFADTVPRNGPFVAVGELAAIFNASHSDYQASVVDGVIVVRPAQNRAAYLDSAAPLVSADVRGLMTVIGKLFAPLNPNLDRDHSGGRVGVDAGPVGVEVDRGENFTLRLDTRGHTVMNVLNQVAKASGHPWIVVTDSETPPRILQAGFVHRHGTTTEVGVYDRSAGR